MFSFTITFIKAGWFDVRVQADGQRADVANSYYLDNDAPAILLNNLNLLLEKKNDEAWLCWHDEPGAYLWHLKRCGNNFTLSIGTTVAGSFGLPGQGAELAGVEVQEQMLDCTVNAEKFASLVYAAFVPHSRGAALKAYEQGWMPFPTEAFHRLGELLSEMRGPSPLSRSKNLTYFEHSDRFFCS